jgi:hypothetical protein
MPTQIETGKADYAARLPARRFCGVFPPRPAALTGSIRSRLALKRLHEIGDWTRAFLAR